MTMIKWIDDNSVRWFAGTLGSLGHYVLWVLRFTIRSTYQFAIQMSLFSVLLFVVCLFVCY